MTMYVTSDGKGKGKEMQRNGTRTSGTLVKQTRERREEVKAAGNG
jgi:hypothetical protein